MLITVTLKKDLKETIEKTIQNIHGLLSWEAKFYLYWFVGKLQRSNG